MNKKPPLVETRQIIVIDRQPYWRDLFCRAFAAAFAVAAFDSYSALPFYDDSAKQARDLVVLGCASIGPDERRVIDHVLAHKYPLVVLCATSLPCDVAHHFFQQKGVADVTEKTTDPERLLQIVETALQSRSPRNSYQVVEQEGKL